MILVYLLIFGSMLIMGATAVYGLWWAAKQGQFADMTKGATAIFDSDEPVGKMTDMVLPPKKKKTQRNSGKAEAPTH
jgi:cbb3-type cytochrome oxidase maturation protein